MTITDNQGNEKNYSGPQALAYLNYLGINPDELSITYKGGKEPDIERARPIAATAEADNTLNIRFDNLINTGNADSIKEQIKQVINITDNTGAKVESASILEATIEAGTLEIKLDSSVDLQGGYQISFDSSINEFVDATGEAIDLVGAGSLYVQNEQSYNFDSDGSSNTYNNTPWPNYNIFFNTTDNSLTVSFTETLAISGPSGTEAGELFNRLSSILSIEFNQDGAPRQDIISSATKKTNSDFVVYLTNEGA